MVIPPVAFGDMTCGAVLAGALGTALFNRTRTGQGEKVTVSLYGMGLYSLIFPVFESQLGTEFPLSRKTPALPMMASFKAGDGKWFYMANVDHEKHYGDLMHQLGRDDLVDDERFKSRTAAQKNVVEFIELLDAEFAKYDRDTCLRMMRDADIAYSLINHVGDNINDPQVDANDILKPVTMRNGETFKIPNTPVRFGSTKIDDMGMGPLLGEHSLEIGKSLGYTDEELAALVADGVLGVQK